MAVAGALLRHLELPRKLPRNQPTEIEQEKGEGEGEGEGVVYS